MSDKLPEKPSLRAADADRDAVVERLQAAASEGRLDLEEFEERMTAAYRARTFGELAPLTADLPQNAPDGPPEITLHATGSSVTRRGAWVVPRRIVVKGNFGTTKLDLTQARLLSDEVEVAIDAGAGTVVIIVPPDTRVDASGLRTSFGSTNIRTDTTPESGGKARLHLTLVRPEPHGHRDRPPSVLLGAVVARRGRQLASTTPGTLNRLGSRRNPSGP